MLRIGHVGALETAGLAGRFERGCFWCHAALATLIENVMGASGGLQTRFSGETPFWCDVSPQVS